MRLRQLNIQHFRGIESLCWTPSSDVVCLLGPGDSTKTTVLDAIEFVLSSKWTIQFTDNDFHNADISKVISIEATVGDVPDELLSDLRFGHQARGWTEKGALRDEPEEGDEPVLTIRLSVDGSLEPVWVVVNDRLLEAKPIRASDRAKLGCYRIGSYMDRHLSWSRGTVLAKLTDAGDGIGAILANASRAARDAVDPTKLVKMGEVATAAQSLGVKLGVSPKREYQPRLDLKATGIGTGAVALHDGAIPARAAGLGSSRLLAMALQLQVAKQGGITLIDEVEHALEPHRLRRLLRTLSADGGTSAVLTTHSRLVIEEMGIENLAVVRNDAAGTTTVDAIDPDLRNVVRSCSEALLAKTVVVCEGRTEMGFLTALDDWWSKTGDSFGLLGVALANGGGSNNMTDRALKLQRLGYRTMLFADSDKPLEPPPAALQKAGIHLAIWADQVSTEERLARDLPWQALVEVIKSVAEENFDLASVRNAVATKLGRPARVLSNDPMDWIAAVPEAKLRTAIGAAAKAGDGWFKRFDLARGVGETVTSHWESLAGTNLREVIENLRTWLMADG